MGNRATSVWVKRWGAAPAWRRRWQGQRAVVEGVATADAVNRLATGFGIDMPVVAAVDAVLHHGMAIDVMIEGLLSRPYRSE